VCVLLWSPITFAQETTGSIVGTVTSEDGVPLPGVTVTIEDPERGFVRTTACSPRGTYNLAALRPARYNMTASLSGFQTVKRPVRVELGRTVTNDIHMKVGAVTDTIEVTGEAPLVDVTSSVVGMTFNTDHLTGQIPLTRDVTQISMLAPATMPADSKFGNHAYAAGFRYFTPGQSLVAVGGSSIAENTYLVNGLNITSFREMMGSSFVPMEFVNEVQVKTGGYEAEFGRATGGVINMVTKSGSNTLHGGASLYWEPESLQQQEPDTYQLDYEGNQSVFDHNQEEERDLLEGNASLGGPLVRDRLFLFGFLRYIDSTDLTVWETYGQRSTNQAPYWGGKLDWSITTSHRLEGTYLSDQTDVGATFYDFDPAEGEFVGDGQKSTRSRGGDSAIPKCSGSLGENLLLSAQAGLNDFDRTNQAENADICPYAWDSRDGGVHYLGCWAEWAVGTDLDERRAYRLDLDWFVGNHSLRGGLDFEQNTSSVQQMYSGGVYYRYFMNGLPDTDPSEYRYPDLPWDQELVRVWHYNEGGSYDVLSNAAYVQDSWAATPNLTLNFGLRYEQFENRNAVGETFIRVDDQFAPRLGVVWDVSGDGRSKLHASIGRYHLPLSSSTSILQAGGYYLEEWWYPLEGVINNDGSPEAMGDELENNLRSDGEIPDPRLTKANDIEPMSQDELIVGFERLLGSTWSAGARFVARRFNEVIEDIAIDKALWEKYGIVACGPTDGPCFEYRLANPGNAFNGYYDIDGDGELDEISFTAEELEFPSPMRDYYAVELFFKRRFAQNWMLQGSYTWSHLYGNYGGLVNSDLGQTMPNLNQNFDFPGLMEHSTGDLPNDRRHNLKVFGVYQWDFGLQLGGNFWYRSGRAINGFGMHPTDPWAQSYGPDSFYNNGQPCPRGCAGRTEGSWALDLMLKYDLPAFGADWFVRADIMNIFNNNTVTQVNEYADDYTFQSNPNYLLPRYHQPPRSVRLGFGLNF